MYHNKKSGNFMERSAVRLRYFCIIAFFLPMPGVFAQEGGNAEKASYLTYSWKKVANQMPDEWYASADALKVAENVLFCQKEAGGWEKNTPFHHPLSDAEKSAIVKARSEAGATIDNGATTTEMSFLARVYALQKKEACLKGFEKGLHYLLEAQYENGGWPQFYPLRKGYYTHITYNDDAMINVLRMLRDIIGENPLYAQLPVSTDMKKAVKKAFDKGIDCILKTQIKINGQPTVWCAQHNEVTLLPADARSYELASFSGSESMNIVRLLLSLEEPSGEVVNAVKAAMAWLDAHKISGIRVVNRPAAGERRNIMITEDSTAPPLVARFYDLETGQPFFCNRDGIKRAALADLGPDRRNGYSWYSGGFERLQDQYASWLTHRQE